MLSIFKSKRPEDVKGIRSALLQFIKEQLQKVEGGEGANIKGLYLYLTCSEADRHLYESAVFAAEQDRFRDEEVQRIADDFDLSLPAAWVLEFIFEPAPAEAIVAPNIDAALFIATNKKQLTHKEFTAYIRVLNGIAEKDVYPIRSVKSKLNIGREKKVQTADGFYRENNIAFTNSSTDASNRSVSRQHAHIEWDAESAGFVLYADEGGIPPLNKTKVRDAEGDVTKIQTIEIGHQLKEGDQIMLGESAVLEFTLHQPENHQ
ncbi:FHA domain-containing protein [Segetibacter sp. 3557_3]|uniref:FHA domain-containing protein n=1 Tax=Segetibacter sp. 3557_3 TaxID=2547429 RepID=UPI0010586EB8|nr:FHA domain-containing protein [Segetibacter sp. 3557_3]TDH26567.1 FHA domain-containing protein [Segetibacter sp. 3557_3]